MSDIYNMKLWYYIKIFCILVVLALFLSFLFLFTLTRIIALVILGLLILASDFFKDIQVTT